MSFESDRCLASHAPGGLPDGAAAVIQASWQAPERFAEIYDAYFVEIHKYVERRLGRDIADDLAAETFVASFRQRQRYDRARGDARAWLYGIATNLIRRHRSRKSALPGIGTRPSDKAVFEFVVSDSDRRSAVSPAAAAGRTLTTPTASTMSPGTSEAGLRGRRRSCGACPSRSQPASRPGAGPSGGRPRPGYGHRTQPR